MTAAFCAICTNARGPFARRPLGRDNALVTVCRACDDEPARAVTGPDRGYEPPDLARLGAILPAFANAANRVAGVVRHGSGGATIAPLSPGCILVRVAVRRPGRAPIDGNEAWQSLKGKPWHRELKHLGSTSRYHLFERPDPEAAKRARQGESSPLDALEQFRVKP